MATLIETFLGIGNGVGKQDRGNQPPYRRYGPDTEIQYRPPFATRTGKNKLNSLQKGSRYEHFSIDPTSSIQTPIADAIFADAISETPNFGSKTTVEHRIERLESLAVSAARGSR